MHILFVADGDSKYGALNSLYQLACELMHYADNITISIVLTKDSDKVADFEKIGCQVYSVAYSPYQYGKPFQKWKYPIKYIVRGVMYWWGRLFAIRELETKLDIKAIDIIHSNSSREDFGAMIAQKYNIPLIWHIREFGDLDYSVYSYRKNYIDFMNANATTFIAISQAVREHWINKGIEKNKIIQIYNGVKENPVRKVNYPKDGDAIRLVMLGSLNKTKGQHHLIQAIASLSDVDRRRVSLDIVGDGSNAYTAILKHMISENQLSKQIQLLGYQKNFDTELHHYDCGIMCSRSEGFGRVTVEYMMAGLPVIASDTGANPELVEDGVNGLLYRYGDIKDLAGQISYMLDNGSKIAEMGMNARKIAQQKFTSAINAYKVKNEYLKIIDKQ